METKFDILVDMDGTICDWNGWFDNHVDDLYPQFASIIPRKEDNKSFDMWAGHTLEVQEAITHIFNYENFYADIPEIPGAMDALKQMDAEGHNVSLVTSPWWYNNTCLEDKKNWVKNHLGEEWMDSLIITKDKTKIRGDFLIDDKPEIHGRYDVHQRQWIHILFDQPYNRQIDRPRLEDWSQWKPLLQEEWEKSFMWDEYPVNA